MKRVVLGLVALGLVIAIAVKAYERSSVGPRNADRGDLTSMSEDASPDANTHGNAGKAAQDASQQIRTSITQRQATLDAQLLSPKNDGWATEAMAEAALKQLKTLGKRIPKPQDASQAKLEDIIDSSCVSRPLRPAALVQRFKDSVTIVRDVEPATSDRSPLFRGVEGFRENLQAFLNELPKSEHDLHPHFKIINVQAGELWTTRVLGELTSSDGSTTRQVNLTWNCTWSYDQTNPPKLVRLDVESYREADVIDIAERWFLERTTGVIGEHPELMNQLGHGHHYWLQRVERAQRFDTSVRNGLAVGDINGDGLEDLYLCQPPGLPNRLFVQERDGTASEQSSEYGLDLLDQSSAALFIDVDNDGDQDLCLGTPVGILVFENLAEPKDGKRFELRATLACDYDVQSLSATDYDSDGKLDLFVCVYRTATPKANRHFLYRDAVGGGENRLFRNQIKRDDAWTFEDVTEATGLTEGGDRYSLAASWEDFDTDGDPDLYVANDFGPNCLYENRDGMFVNIAEEAGVVDIGSGMSVSWGDYNRDGRPDLYVGNMFSSAGQRVTGQASFRETESEEIRKIYQRLAKGNSLFENLGNGKFREVGGHAGVELGRWAWSSIFTDLNNDGWEDLFVANGYITTEDTGDL